MQGVAHHVPRCPRRAFQAASVRGSRENALERSDAAKILQNEHYASVRLIAERRRSEEDVQLLNRSSGEELHTYLAPDAFLAGKGLLNRFTDETGLAERAVAATGGDIPGMQAVEDFSGAVAEDAAPPDAEEGRGSGIIVQDGHVLIYQEDVRRHSIEQLAEQNFVAHLCDRNAHGSTVGNRRPVCQHKSRESGERARLSAAPPACGATAPPVLHGLLQDADKQIRTCLRMRCRVRVDASKWRGRYSF